MAGQRVSLDDVQPGMVAVGYVYLDDPDTVRMFDKPREVMAKTFHSWRDNGGGVNTYTLRWVGVKGESHPYRTGDELLISER